METIRKHAGQQKDTAGVLALALFAVLAYSLWGAYVLHGERLGKVQGPQVADMR